MLALSCCKTRKLEKAKNLDFCKKSLQKFSKTAPVVTEKKRNVEDLLNESRPKKMHKKKKNVQEQTESEQSN